MRARTQEIYAALRELNLPAEAWALIAELNNLNMMHPDHVRAEVNRSKDAERKRVSREMSKDSSDTPIYINKTIGDRNRGVGERKGGPRTSRTLPSDWEPSAETVSKLVASGRTEGEIRAELVRFRDYCQANGKEYRDFDAAFRNRFTSQFYSGGGPPKSSRTVEAARKLMEEISERNRTGSGNGGNSLVVQFPDPAARSGYLSAPTDKGVSGSPSRSSKGDAGP